MSRVVGFLCAAVMFGLPAMGLAQEDGGTDAGIPVPPGWYCSEGYYGTDDGCDCGCGELDPDCGGAGCATVGCDDTACEYCYDAEGNFTDCPGDVTDAGTTTQDASNPGTDAGTTGTDANTGGGGGGGSDDTDDPDDRGLCSGVPAGNAAAMAGLGLIALLALRRRR